MSRPLRLTLANDYPIVVEGLAAILEPFADRVRVVECVAGELPVEDSDIVLYDTFGAPDATTVDVAATRDAYRATRLVLYTWQVEAVSADGSAAEHASAVISKAVSGAELVEALERVHAAAGPGAGGGPGGGPADGEPGGTWPGQRDGLTERESEILALIVQGLSNQEIAERMFLSINTVKSYIRTAYRKMHVDSRSRAVLWGVENGFLPRRVRTSAHRPADAGSG